MLLVGTIDAQIPGSIHYQGRIAVRRSDFDGPGNFKFALVNADGSQVYWRNDADADADGIPDNAVRLTVSAGLFSVQLGDVSLPNMAPLSSAVFNNGGVYLRIWFDDGGSGFQHLVPDQRITSVAYAMIAAAVTDGVITPEKLAPSALAVITALSNRLNAVESLIPSGLTLASPQAGDDALVAQGFQPFTALAAAAWESGPTTDAPSPRQGHSGIWTGQEFVVWGGSSGPGLYSGTGSIYRPDLNQWRAISINAAPEARLGHSVIWTGQEMIVWGGFSASGYLRSGARFQPGSQTWTPVATAGAPSERDRHSSVWTGTRMVVWGGRNADGALGDCFSYDPAADQWTTIGLSGGPSSRFDAAMVWTGDRLVVWGGEGSAGTLNTGARLVFSNGAPSQWLSITTANAPTGRTDHTAVWTGQRMIVWGGRSSGAFFDDGGVFDPVANSWEPVSTTGAPAPRSGHSAVWSGREMLIVCGETSLGPVASGSAFNPATGKWRSLGTGGNPRARSGAATVWTGSELLAFGGGTGSQPLGSLERLNPQPTWYLYRKP